MKTTGKKVIAVDFDDVVAHFNGHFHIYHNNKYGTELKYENLVRYDDWEVLYGCDKETMNQRAHEFYRSEEHLLISPVTGAKEAIEYLAQSYTLEIVTSRPQEVSDITKRWIEKYFPVHFSNLHFTNGFAG